MRGNKRRRSPGPMDRRGDDRRPQRGGGYPQPGFRDRRPRSPSPDARYSRRSPPPFNKRYRREDNGYDRYGGRPGPEQYDRRVSYRDRYDDDPYGPAPYGRRPASPPAVKREPLTYKEFMFKLPDDITPEEAQKEYQRYLAEYWGSEIRAEFQAKKNEGWMRRKYDLREQLQGLARRNAAAKEAAQGFADALAAGQLDPQGPDFNQGQGLSAESADQIRPARVPGQESTEDMKANLQALTLHTAETNGAEGGGDASAAAAMEGSAAPVASWASARVAADLALSKDLMLKLDAEKGIEQNAFGPQLQQASAETEPAAEPEGMKVEAETEEAPVDEKGEDAQAPNGIPEQPKPEPEAAPAPEEASKPYEEQLGQLDLQLTYLWRVHGVDYYAGIEHAEPESYDACAGSRRKPRCTRPEDGEQPIREEEEKQLKTMEEQVDRIWKPRLTAVDPFEGNLQNARAQQLIEEWIEEQVIKIDENKWGCKLSQKMFVGREYVLKHVRNKHTAVMEAKQEEIYDQIYQENFERARKEEQERAREAVVREQGAAWGAPPPGAPPGLPNPGWGANNSAGDGWQGGWEGGAEGFEGNGHGGWSGGRGTGPPRTGSGFGSMEGIPAGAIMGGPAVGPGQMLVLAPGAGPLGPFIAVPAVEGGGPPMNSPMMGRGGPGRGRGMMGRGPPRGRGFGGPGGFGGPPKGLKSYYDLDAPENQRSVLDYGDL